MAKLMLTMLAAVAEFERDLPRDLPTQDISCRRSRRDRAADVCTAVMFPSWPRRVGVVLCAGISLASAAAPQSAQVHRCVTDRKVTYSDAPYATANAGAGQTPSG